MWVKLEIFGATFTFLTLTVSYVSTISLSAPLTSGHMKRTSPTVILRFLADTKNLRCIWSFSFYIQPVAYIKQMKYRQEHLNGQGPKFTYFYIYCERKDYSAEAAVTTGSLRTCSFIYLKSHSLTTAAIFTPKLNIFVPHNFKHISTPQNFTIPTRFLWNLLGNYSRYLEVKIAYLMMV